MTPFRLSSISLRIASAVFCLACSSCLSPAARQQAVAIFTGCPAYEENVAFPSARSASNDTAGDAPERDDEKEPTEFGLKKGALAKLGDSDYLNAIYLGVKKDFEKSGMQFKETEDGGLLGRGFRLKRGRDVTTKKTVEILIAIDGDMSFDHGSSNLTKLALETVARIGKAMDAYPEVLAKIGGHTDSTGAKEFNRQLSFARATAVKNGLVNSYKIDPARVIELKGYADDQKIVDTMAAEARNRRVEIRIVTPSGSSLIKIQ